MTDKTIKCKDCGASFIFTVKEQEFYAEKGFDNDPTRCPDCRRINKEKKNQGRGGNSFGGGNSYGGGRSSYGNR